MAVVRGLIGASAGGLLLAAIPAVAQAQVTTGTISGVVRDSASQQPLANVTVSVPGTTRGALTGNDGRFTIGAVPAGVQTVRAARIGYAARTQQVTVAAGGTATANFSVAAQSANLTEVVVVGYGTQTRESVTGAVAQVRGEEANVGVQPNANGLITARVAGVNVIQNSGEPGGGSQIRVRGGTSISASNEPLYVIDGVPLQNEGAVATGLGIGGGGAALARSPLNTLNPNDIASITVLKDASATAIYGSRGANGVILIETKRGAAGATQTEYETFVGAATPARKLDFATGDQYRSFVNDQYAIYKADSAAGRATLRGLPFSAVSALGTANTDWLDEITRVGIAQNHNLSFSGGSQTTQYRAALNYFDQQGVVIANGLTRYQGRVNAQNQAFGGRLQTQLNLTASRVNNRFLPFENGGGFTGGVFTNAAVFNPTRSVTTETGTFYEIGSGAQDVRNPVALARQITDRAPENRVLGNVTASLELFPALTSRTTVGIDAQNSVRQTYIPLANPVGAAFGGQARQAERSLQNVNFQQLLTLTPRINDANTLEVLGGYEYTAFGERGVEVEGRGFLTDAFRFDNLNGQDQNRSPIPVSYNVPSELVSFFTRANYSLKGRYFLSGVFRRDGSSRLAEGNKWANFPGISASWRVSEEGFMSGRPLGLSTLALRAGYGVQGSQAVRPYQTQLLFRPDPAARYPLTNPNTPITGFSSTQVANPDLKWETSRQTNLGLDYGFANNRFTGSLDVYSKTTKDLLLEVAVPQPAVVPTRIENVGSLRNRGFEAALDANILNEGNRSFTSGLVLTVERNTVLDLGDRPFITTATVFGQGQSGQFAQRLIPGQPLGTFWGVEYAGLNDAGQQLFRCSRSGTGNADCVNGVTTQKNASDERIIGDANPAFSLGLRSNGTFRNFDASWLWRAEVNRDVFNNTALVYETTTNATQGRNFLASAITNGTAFGEPAIYSSRWIEDGSFLRLQNVTVGYNFSLPTRLGARQTRVFLSGDNLLLFTPYSGFDPEVFVRAGGTDVVGAASRGVDYLAYPRARNFTAGARIQF